MILKQRTGFVWILLLLLALSINSFSQNSTVGAKLDKSDILLGDQTVLRLTANIPANGKIQFPVISDTISSKIQIVEIGKLDTLKEKNGRWLVSRAYVITAFESGIQTVPSFKFATADGQLQTDPLPLQVQEVKVDTTKGVFDIKQPMAVKYTFIDWVRDNWGWLISGILLIILLIGLWFYYRKRVPQKTVLKEVKPAVPADVEALQKLESLRTKQLWQKEETKAYYIELTDIIREYLEKRYNIPALEQTSEEILSSLNKPDLTDESRQTLRNILVLADLVKFAKHKPQTVENELCLDNAILFVRQSKPVFQPEIKVQGNDGSI
ncbi:MAG: BatD family protein [Bacteroidota bacterium]